MQGNETTGFREGALVIYDLRDAAAWERAGRDRREWGRHHSAIHELDVDHIIIEFKNDEAIGGAA